MHLRTVEKHIIDIVNNGNGTVSGAGPVSSEHGVNFIVGLKGVNDRYNGYHPEGRG